MYDCVIAFRLHDYWLFNCTVVHDMTQQYLVCMYSLFNLSSYMMIVKLMYKYMITASTSTVPSSADDLQTDGMPDGNFITRLCTSCL